jgi:hypothetical protein
VANSKKLRKLMIRSSETIVEGLLEDIGNPRCKVEDGYITFRKEPSYEIALKECDTPEKILHLVYHLSTKSWTDKRDIATFAILAGHHNRLKGLMYGEVRNPPAS